MADSANSTNTVTGNSTAAANSTSDASEDEDDTGDDSDQEDDSEDDDEEAAAKAKAYTDISGEINSLIPDAKAFLNGFIHGSNTIKASTICQSAMIGAVDDAVNLLNVRWFWLPEYTIKAKTGYDKLVSDGNTAYLYCNWAQAFASIS